jgi:hypothetical protein
MGGRGTGTKLITPAGARNEAPIVGREVVVVVVEPVGIEPTTS